MNHEGFRFKVWLNDSHRVSPGMRPKGEKWATWVWGRYPTAPGFEMSEPFDDKEKARAAGEAAGGVFEGYVDEHLSE